MKQQLAAQQNCLQVRHTKVVELRNVPFLPTEFGGRFSRWNWNFPRPSLVHIEKGPNTEMVQPTAVLRLSALYTVHDHFQWRRLQGGEYLGRADQRWTVFGRWAGGGRCRAADMNIRCFFTSWRSAFSLLFKVFYRSLMHQNVAAMAI